jgi:tetratricopeptide (TPR) repeat protein
MLAGPAGVASATPASGQNGWVARLVAITYRLRSRRWLIVALVVLGLTAAALVVARPYLRAWYHFRAARAELQRYHNPQAIRHLRFCRDIWPNDPDVMLMAARAARRARVYADTERLLWMYRESRGRNEAFVFEHLLLAAELRVDQVADQCWGYVEDGRYDAALLLEALTRGYLRQYRLGQARLCLNRWRELQPNNPQAFYLEGLFLLDYNHAQSAAVDSYRRALELDPDHEEARLGLAVALLTGKGFAEAAEHFRHLLQCQPDNPRVQVGLAECLDGLGETAEAVRLVDDVLSRQPEFASALSLRGKLALRNGQLAESQRWLRQALRHNPMDHRAHYNLILCLEKSGQEEEAQRQRQRLQQMEQDVARFNEIVTKEIAQKPADPVLHCTLGQMLLRRGQREEGIRWLQSALRLDPNCAPARQALADYLAKAKGESRPGSP